VGVQRRNLGDRVSRIEWPRVRVEFVDPESMRAWAVFGAPQSHSTEERAVWAGQRIGRHGDQSGCRGIGYVIVQLQLLSPTRAASHRRSVWRSCLAADAVRGPAAQGNGGRDSGAASRYRAMSGLRADARDVVHLRIGAGRGVPIHVGDRIVPADSLRRWCLCQDLGSGGCDWTRILSVLDRAIARAIVQYGDFRGADQGMRWATFGQTTAARSV